MLATLTLSLAFAFPAPQTNSPPLPPTIREPAPLQQVNPYDVHMETAPMSDPDPADTHVASDWEIWTVAPLPLQRVWHADDVTGLEKVHTHLGDGVFENSHSGWTRLFENTRFQLRVRHRDSSGDPATEWSPWSTVLFDTGPADVKNPLLLDDVQSSPAPAWTDPSGADVDLSTGTSMPSLSLESATGQSLLRIAASSAAGNSTTNPPPLPSHEPVRIVVDAGNVGGNLVLPETDLTLFEHDCEDVTIRLPVLNVPPFQRVVFWVSADGATYIASLQQSTPDFSLPARGLLPPWVAREPGYVVDVAASGFQLPVNIAFVPHPGTRPGDPKFYVTELYGSVKTVTNDGTVLTYASNLLNYAPSGVFPGSGEQGVTGIAVDPASGDVFVSLLQDEGVSHDHIPRIVRMSSIDGGRTAASQQTILHMTGEPQGQSHQISCLEIVGGLLFCHMGDGFFASTARNLGSFRGKILRLNLDGSPVPSNPFYDGGARDSRDYVFAYGVRNPFGGAWRALDGARYMVENGPSIDRFARIDRGRDYQWSGSDNDMLASAIYNWSPARGPVNLAFVQPQTFGGSGFPPGKMDHAFVTESGPTYAQGQQSAGKRISEFVLDPSGNLVAGPLPFVEYVGDGFATAVGLAAGPDGLYFTELYRDAGASGPTAAGARVLRIRFGEVGDCNANGEPDWCEIATGAVDDCNANGIPDTCDLALGASHDFDANGVLDDCDPLSEDRDTASLFFGSAVGFRLDAGAALAGGVYLLVGSASGTSPGTPLGAVTLPLNVLGDPWFETTVVLANSPSLQMTLGVLDPSGHAQSTLVVPPNSPLAWSGIRLHHAFVVFDFATGSFAFASNAVPLRLTL